MTSTFENGILRDSARRDCNVEPFHKLKTRKDVNLPMHFPL